MTNKQSWEKKIKEEFGEEIYDKTFAIAYEIAIHDNFKISEEVIWTIARSFKSILTSKSEQIEKHICLKMQKAANTPLKERKDPFYVLKEVRDEVLEILKK